MTHYELSIVAFLAAVLVLIPSPFQWRTGNVAAFAIIAWAFVVDVVYGINATIWANNVSNVFPIWCDIATNLITGASYALPISFFCICKHLEEVSSSRIIIFNSKDRWRRMVFEAVMCFGLPLVFMGLHHIVQDRRFDITEDIGCQPTAYVSIPAIFIIWFPPLLFSVATLIYAAISLHHFDRRRLVFASQLKGSKSGLTITQYFWLISTTITNLTWNTITTILNLYINLSGGLRPWTSWNDVHSHWNRVDIWSQDTMLPGSRRIMMVLWWSVPVSSLIFFIFQYGFTQEIKEEYTRAWRWLKKTFCCGRHLEERQAGSLSRSLSHPRLKPLKLVPRGQKGVSKMINSAFVSCISSPVVYSTRARHHFNQNTEIGSSTGDVPSTINRYSDDLPHIRMHSSMDQSTTEVSSTWSHVHASDGGRLVHLPEIPRLAHLPEIPRLPSFSSYLPPSPSFTNSGDQFYHRPFCGPSICPVTRPSQLEGIVVTVHRHASIDIIV